MMNNDENSDKFICKICNIEITGKRIGIVHALATKHLKQEHGLTVEDYLVNYELGGIHPKCACGCGEDVHLNKGKTWTWNKYAKDSHVGKVNSEEARELKTKILESRKYKFDPVEYYNTAYDVESLKLAAADFKTKQFTLSDLEDKYKLDRRTLQKAWFTLNILSVEEYNEITNFIRFHISSEKRVEFIRPSNNIYTIIYNMIITNPGRYTIYSLVDEYNKVAVEKINIHPYNLYEELLRLYGDGINAFLAKGYHSREEFEFFKILKFYLPEHKIILGYRIQGYKFIYDIAIDDRLIIEYNSTGRYHSTVEQLNRDTDKRAVAEEHGFIFKVLTLEDILDINTINLIKEWLH